MRSEDKRLTLGVLPKTIVDQSTNYYIIVGTI